MEELQGGVGGDVEAQAAAMRSVVAPSERVAFLDAANAFNSVSRAWLLREPYAQRPPRRLAPPASQLSGPLRSGGAGGGGIPSCRGVRQGVVLGAHGYRIATGVGQGSWLHRRRSLCTTPNAQRVGGRHPRGRHGAQRFSHPQRRVIARRRRRLRRVLAPAALVAGDTCGGHVRMRGGRVKRTPPAYAHAGRTACGPAGG